MNQSLPLPTHGWRYYDIVVALFIASLLTANVISVKLIAVGSLIVPAGVIIFPVSYILGDVLTEVYGYRYARRAIWLGFLGNLLAVAAISLAGQLPAPSFWQGQAAYDSILGFTPRLLLASFTAYLIGEFTNSAVLAKMKLWTQGRHLWARTIGSTLIGQGLDSLVFITIAFGGQMIGSALLTAVLGQWLFKSLYEALATPLTYLVINRLKEGEGVDSYDHTTNINPFRLAG